MENPVQSTILEQYKVYNYSKEKFIDRTFETNRFYMVTCLIILSATYIVNLLTPSLLIMVAICALGMFTSVLWWLNAVSYDVMIKIKYAHILEVLEQSLPKQPFREEFKEISAVRADKKFQYPDVQKTFSTIVFITFAVVCALNLIGFLNIKFS